jgi:hypothetical protein
MKVFSPVAGGLCGSLGDEASADAFVPPSMRLECTVGSQHSSTTRIKVLVVLSLRAWLSTRTW